MTRAKPILRIQRNTDAAEMSAQLVRQSPVVPPANLEDLARPQHLIERHTNHHASGDRYPIGAVLDVPLQEIDENEFGARVYYSTSEVEECGLSLKENGQTVPAVGYVHQGRVILIDGQKRLRGARVAGLSFLRVDIKAKPDDPIANYLESRRVNLERSPQTALDDAAQWQRLIDERAVASAAELARQLKVSEGKISQTLSLNKIPSRVRLAMVQRPTTCGLRIAYELAALFPSAGETVDPDREQLVLDLVDEIGSKELSVSQAKTLIAARLGPPRTRARGDAVPFSFGGSKGLLKVFPGKGALELSIKGLQQDQLDKLKQALERAVKA